MRQCLGFLIPCLTLWLVWGCTGPKSTEHKQPNFIVILADDLGYGDLGCYGNQTIATPNVDLLAKTGMRFTDFYAAGAWCLPSRKGLMTGLHPYRGGLRFGSEFSNRQILPEMLSKAGYATALLGKWHLGMEEGLHPLDQGFDYFYGTAGSNDPKTTTGKIQVYETFRTARKEEDWPVSLIRGRDEIEMPAKQSLFTQRYTKEAIHFIAQNKNRPFFLYLAHNMPHVPIFASERFKSKSKGGLFGDVVEELDWSVGEIMKTLKEEGLTENTLVIFTSDNGPWTMFKEFGGQAKPLRGAKGTGWEGGPGVPAIFNWPGKIKPAVSSAFAVNLDLYSTFAELAGAQLPTNYQVDSLDLSGVLFRNEPSPRNSYLFFSGSKWARIPFSYRSGDYKIHFRTNDKDRDPNTAATISPIPHNPPLLFDLAKDRGETTNIAMEHPDLVAQLKKEFNDAVRELNMARSEGVIP